MKSMKTLLFCFLSFTSICISEEIPKGAKALIDNYPQIKTYENNKIIFKDGSSLIYDDGKKKSFKELLENPDLEDQFTYAYSTDSSFKPLLKNFDPGRIRNEEFFKKIYGSSKESVKKNLKSIMWCPKIAGQTIRITNVIGIAEKVKQLSADIDKHPEFAKYIKNIGGTFNWRNIAGTKRISMHSFGMTIDINTSFSHYWQWDCDCTNEDAHVKYKNSIPLQLVQIFEKHGFIWGGKWYHYDTMHFEYRPELIFNKSK